MFLQSYMNTIEEYLKISPSPLKLAEGRILISVPFYNDPAFNRSVVLLVEHNRKGSVGLILNQQSSTPVRKVVKDIFTDDPIYCGGPVMHNNAFAIHNFANSKSATQVAPNVYLGYDEIFLSIVEHKAIKELKYKFFVGYSGWSAGQLEEELESKMWVVGHGSEKLLLDTPADQIWEQAVKELGEDYHHWLHFPTHICDN